MFIAIDRSYVRFKTLFYNKACSVVIIVVLCIIVVLYAEQKQPEAVEKGQGQAKYNQMDYLPLELACSTSQK